MLDVNNAVAASNPIKVFSLYFPKAVKISYFYAITINFMMQVDFNRGSGKWGAHHG